MSAPDIAQVVGCDADADEAARVLVAMLPYVERVAVAELHALLSHHLAEHRPVGDRERRLGLLCDLIDQGTLPSASAYTEAREREAAEGRNWPAQSSLTEAFGSYERALSTAVRYSERRAGGRGAGAPVHHDRRWTKTYTRQEIIEAIRRCRDDLALASWPGSTVFFSYADAGRRAARLTGGDDPRLPTRKQLRRCFESYAQAVDAARRPETHAPGLQRSVIDPVATPGPRQADGTPIDQRRSRPVAWCKTASDGPGL